MLQSSPRLASKRDRSLVTAFPSPATAALFRTTIPGSMVLACYFALSQPASLSVRPFCSTTVPGSPRFRPLPRFLARYNSACRFTCRYSGLHSPAGLLPPSDQSVQPVSLPVGPPSESARFPLAPRCRFFFNCGCRSSFPGRYVSGGLLFLKPLGTSSTMLPNPARVNNYCDSSTCFPQNLLALFRACYRESSVSFL
jgi:hypothetical protein